MKVISYTLFLKGTSLYFSKYINGLFKNIQLQKKFFPDWKIHIYHDSSIGINSENSYGKDLYYKLQKEGLQLYCVGNDYIDSPTYIRAGYRFMAINNKNIDIVLFRDIDCLLSEEDSIRVDEWLSSGEILLHYYPNNDINDFSAGGLGIKLNRLDVRPNYFETIKLIIPRYKYNYKNNECRGIDELWLSYYFSKIYKYSIPINMMKSGTWMFKNGDIFAKLANGIKSKTIKKLIKV